MKRRHPQGLNQNDSTQHTSHTGPVDVLPRICRSKFRKKVCPQTTVAHVDPHAISQGATLTLSVCKIDDQQKLAEYNVPEGRRSWDGEGLYVLTKEVRHTEIRPLEFHERWAIKDMAATVESDEPPPYFTLLQNANMSQISKEDTEKVSSLSYSHFLSPFNCAMFCSTTRQSTTLGNPRRPTLRGIVSRMQHAAPNSTQQTANRLQQTASSAQARILRHQQ